MTEITLKTFLIVCPLVFLGGFVDSIAGGGGLITLPAYLIAGLPVHNAIATNKLSSCCGTTVTAVRFFKNGMINLKIGIPSALLTLVGAALGSTLSLKADDQLLSRMMLVVLPVAAFIVLNRRIFHENEDISLEPDFRLYAKVCLFAFVIGMYDGFYGPGTGTFLIICFNVFVKMSLRQANGQAKLINLSSNLSSVTVFLLNGQIILLLGLAAAACNMLGNWLGSGLAIKNGEKIVKPMIILVLILLFCKVLGLY